jgi:transcriptional regulator with XRE-family HTH domain
MNTTPIGEHLKTWRKRRRLSQLDLALNADVSTRHLSFIETGRSQPSRDMVLHIAGHLDVPLRERNVLLLAAGYAPEFPERSLDDPALTAARRAVEVVLRGHEPFPALAIDRHWTLVSANRMLPMLLEGVDHGMLAPPVNVVRLSLHPEGLASRIVNYREWRQHIVERLRHQVELSADSVLIDLLADIDRFPFPEHEDTSVPGPDFGGVAVPLRIRTGRGILNVYSTTTIFGTPIDVTLAELAIESFFPAEAATAVAFRRYAETLDSAR